jgi:FdhD protein
LAVEEPVEIRLGYVRADGIRVQKSVSVTMRTPGMDKELACGFLFTEGIVRDPAQIAAVEFVDGENGNRVLVTLADGVGVDTRSLERHFYTASSCGVCGKASIDALGAAGACELPAGEWTVDSKTVVGLPGILRAAQSVFERTGGLHAAGLFDAAGRLLCVCEDVGRHNAVDKVIGSQFLAGAVPLEGRVLVLSGRASFELVQKAVVAGIPMIVAVGAPSSLAVETARKFGATLMGFVRDRRVNIYSGAHRLCDIAAPSAAI